MKIGAQLIKNELAYELFNNMLIAADMIENLEYRSLIYAVMEAAEKAALEGLNPRKAFMAYTSKFPQIAIDMRFKNWND